MTFDVDSGGSIPESGTEGTVTFSVSVNDECTIEDLDVHIVLVHTFISDLDILLKSPLGTEILLIDQRGGSGEDLLFTLFDDEAANPISVGSAPFTGSFIPIQPLSIFDNENPNGIWTLTVVDSFSGDSGFLYKTGDAFLGGSPGTQLIFNGDATCCSTDAQCSSSGDQCNDGVCNLTTGLCETQPVTDGTACDDDDIHTQNDMCTAGLCDGDVGGIFSCGLGTTPNLITNECEPDVTQAQHDAALALLNAAGAAVLDIEAQRDAILTTLFEFLRVFGVI